MARSILDIYNSLSAEKNTHSELNALQPSIDSAQTLLDDVASPSRVADWRLWLFIVSIGIWTLEKMWDAYRVIVETIVSSAQYASLRWYQQQAIKFQLGYQLIWQNDRFEYPSIDTAAQIVQRAAAIENGNQVIIKAAKISGGIVVPLSSIELSAFRSYMFQIRYPGTSMVIISQSADLLKVYYDIYYDPQIPLATLQPLVESAINDYISNLSFNGELVITNLTDVLQRVSGVVNPVFISAESKYASLSYQPLTISYVSNAGYMNIDSLFPLSTTINYIASV